MKKIKGWICAGCGWHRFGDAARVVVFPGLRWQALFCWFCEPQEPIERQRAREAAGGPPACCAADDPCLRHEAEARVAAP